MVYDDQTTSTDSSDAKQVHGDIVQRSAGFQSRISDGWRYGPPASCASTSVYANRIITFFFVNKRLRYHYVSCQYSRRIKRNILMRMYFMKLVMNVYKIVYIMGHLVYKFVSCYNNLLQNIQKEIYFKSQ